MAEGSIFQKALEISTPAFDSLLGVVQAETQRLERNRALIQNIQQQEKLLRTEQDIKTQAEKDLLEFEAQISKDLADFRTEEEKELIEERLKADKELSAFKSGLQGKESSFTLEDIREFNENAQKKNDSIRNEFSDVFSQIGINVPNVQWTLDQTGSPQYFQQVVNWSENEPAKILTENEYKNRLNILTELSRFVQEGKRKRDTILRHEDLSEIQTDINLISQEQIDDTISTIRNMSVQDKIVYAQRVANGEVAWATEPKVAGTEEEIKERELSADQKDVQEIYTKLSSNSTIVIPDFLRENARNPIPEKINLFDPTVKYRDILRIDKAFQEAAREEKISQIRSIDNEIQIKDIGAEETYQAIQNYIRLMNKSSRLPNTKINPAFNKEQNNFGLRRVDLQNEDLREIWEDRSGQPDIVGDPNSTSIGDILLNNLLFEQEVEKGLKGL